MRMGIQIGAKPDAGFEDPLGMLHDCHRRIEHFLNILCVVAEKSIASEPASDEPVAIRAALSYFRSGGQRHNADEEESLFPRLRSTGTSGIPEIDTLEHDHRDAELLHMQIDSLYVKWIEQGALTPEEQSQLKAATQKLRALYKQHIEIEEKVVFPRAAQMLTPEAVAAMGQEFRQRRS